MPMGVSKLSNTKYATIRHARKVPSVMFAYSRGQTEIRNEIIVGNAKVVVQVYGLSSRKHSKLKPIKFRKSNKASAIVISCKGTANKDCHEL